MSRKTPVEGVDSDTAAQGFGPERPDYESTQQEASETKRLVAEWSLGIESEAPGSQCGQVADSPVEDIEAGCMRTPGQPIACTAALWRERAEVRHSQGSCSSSTWRKLVL